MRLQFPLLALQDCLNTINTVFEWEESGWADTFQTFLLLCEEIWIKYLCFSKPREGKERKIIFIQLSFCENNRVNYKKEQKDKNTRKEYKQQ